jgi:alkylhydroperoxidase family enzyme
MHLHTLQLEEVGETKERIACLSAWEETELFSPRERAALAWTEAVTLVSETHVPDETYQEVRGHFSEKELSDLTLAIAGINVWNRLAIAFRQDPSIAPAVLEQLHAARRASTHV